MLVKGKRSTRDTPGICGWAYYEPLAGAGAQCVYHTIVILIKPEVLSRQLSTISQYWLKAIKCPQVGVRGWWITHWKRNVWKLCNSNSLSALSQDQFVVSYESVIMQFFVGQQPCNGCNSMTMEYRDVLTGFQNACCMKGWISWLYPMFSPCSLLAFHCFLLQCLYCTY